MRVKCADCDEVVDLDEDKTHDCQNETPVERTPYKPSPCCSFCGKKQNEVKKLIAGATVYICNECVKLCQKILEE